MSQIPNRSAFRELEAFELDLISGGTDDYPGIEVVGYLPDEPDFNDPSDGNNGGDYGEGYFGEGNGGGPQPPDLWGLITWVIDKLLGAANSKAERESRVASKFDPAHSTSSGYTYGMWEWRMDNGDRFIDTDGNGTPDFVYRRGGDGNVYADIGDGKGWQATGAVWMSMPQ